MKYFTGNKNSFLFLLYLVFILITKKITRDEYGKIFLKQFSIQDSE